MRHLMLPPQIPHLGYPYKGSGAAADLDAYIDSLGKAVLFYKFDELSGTTAINYGSAGSAADASYVNGPVLNQAGLYGAAVQFDGVDDYLNIPNVAAWANLDAYEWMLIHRVTHNTEGGTGRMIGATGSGYDIQTGISYATGPMIHRVFNTSNTAFQTSTKHLMPTGVWAATNWKFNNLGDRKPYGYLNAAPHPQYSAQPAVTGTFRKPVNAMPVFAREISGPANVGGLLNRVILFGSELTDLERQTIVQLAGMSVPDVTVQVICTGDSLTYGAFGTCSYPSKLAGLLIDNTRVRAYGVSGQNLTNIISIEPTRADLDYNAGLYDRNILVAWVGLVDMYLGASAAATQALYQEYCEDRIAAGWEVIACTATPASKSGVFAGYEDRRQDFNTWLRANYLSFGCSALSDPGGDPTIGAPGAETNTTYYADLLHMTAAGYEIKANLAGAAIASIL